MGLNKFVLYRLLYIKHNDKVFGWSAVVNFHKTVKKDKYHQEETIAYTVEVLMNVCKEAAHSKDIFMISPPENPSKGEMQVCVSSQFCPWRVCPRICPRDCPCVWELCSTVP